MDSFNQKSKWHQQVAWLSGWGGQLSFLQTPVRVPVGVGLESLFPSCLYWVLLCGMPVTSAVPYMLTGLAGCSVGRGISRGARKLAWTPTLIKQKNKNKPQEVSIISLFFFFHWGFSFSFSGGCFCFMCGKGFFWFFSISFFLFFFKWFHLLVVIRFFFCTPSSLFFILTFKKKDIKERNKKKITKWNM